MFEIGHTNSELQMCIMYIGSDSAQRSGLQLERQVVLQSEDHHLL